MVANGGNKIDVSIIKDIVNQDGTSLDANEVKEYTKNELGLQDNSTEDLNINKENMEAVREGMRSVTTETGGTAYSVFKNFDIEVGGKTGSAEAGENINAWFAGFAPYDDPEIAIIVLVENGGHGYYTATVAKEIIAEYFKLKQTNTTKEEAVPYTEIAN